jgi:hypothetical protein
VTYFVANISKVPEGWFKKTCTKSLGLFVYFLQQNLCGRRIRLLSSF